MDSDEEIFAAALERPVDQREAFLQKTCSDSEQRARLAALLAQHDQAASFMEQPACGQVPDHQHEQAGDRIDRYLILRRLGEGGCGVVYLAEQTSPVRRKVALKVIKIGMDTVEVIRRFEAERQALALMDHPDIARVLDAGTTAQGRPYFVMEAVEGAPITRFCDEENLSLAARLNLFVRVCLALQHAHQKGIIHRDIKPSNILVARTNGQPTPRVIDFGIAKATQGGLTEQTLHTMAEQVLGTPAYMSPEQADFDVQDIDTRSDVYALGVLLHELLVGSPPFEPRTSGFAAIEEMRRCVRHVSPRRPSQHLASAAPDRAATIADHRADTPTHLRQQISGDLDWIVMRCLEKSPDRRYDSARDLADDVQRHLDHEPIHARPPDTLYLASRFVARNRLACASVAAILLTLVAGTVVSLRQAIRATRAEHIARAERTDALRRQDQAEDLLTFMLGDFRSELQRIGRLELLDTVGAKAMAYFGELDSRDLTDTALTRQAKALTQIGEIRMEQARYAEAHDAFTSAYERAAALAARHPANADMLFERAQAEFWIGYVAHSRGDTATERIWLTRYRDSALALHALEGDTPRAQSEVTYSHHNLAVLEAQHGNLDAARTGFLAERDTLHAMLKAQPDDAQLRFRLADAASWLGTVAERDGRLDDALQQFEHMAELYADLRAEEPAVARWNVKYAESLAFQSQVHKWLGRYPQAITLLERAASIVSPVVAADPENRRWQASQLHIELEWADLLMIQHQLDAAGTRLHRALDQLVTIVASEPSSHRFTRHLALAWRTESRWRALAGHDDPHEAARRALRLEESRMQDNPSDLDALGALAETLLLLGGTDHPPSPTVQTHWQRALQLLNPHLDRTRDWRLLAPATVILRLLGDNAQSEALSHRLHQSGFRFPPHFEAGNSPAPSSHKPTTSHP